MARGPTTDFKSNPHLLFKLLCTSFRRSFVIFHFCLENLVEALHKSMKQSLVNPPDWWLSVSKYYSTTYCTGRTSQYIIIKKSVDRQLLLSEKSPVARKSENNSKRVFLLWFVSKIETFQLTSNVYCNSMGHMNPVKPLFHFLRCTKHNITRTHIHICIERVLPLRVKKSQSRFNIYASLRGEKKAGNINPTEHLEATKSVNRRF